MADNLTDAAENLALNWLFVPAQSPTRPTTPLTVALVTAAGSDTALGTEVVAGGNAYARQTVVFSTATTGSTANNADLVWTNMPAATIVGVAVFENGGTRIAYGALSANKTTNAGDTFTITSGSLTISIV